MKIKKTPIIDINIGRLIKTFEKRKNNSLRWVDSEITGKREVLSKVLILEDGQFYTLSLQYSPSLKYNLTLTLRSPFKEDIILYDKLFQSGERAHMKAQELMEKVTRGEINY